MSANGCPWGWWALFAAFNPALVNLLGAPQLNPERHVCWYVALRSWSGSCWSRHGGRACRTWNIRSCGLLRGLLGNRGTRANVGSRWRRLGQEMVGVQSDSPQKSIQTLCFRPHYGLGAFPTPLSPNFEPLLLVFWLLLFLHLLPGAVSNPTKKGERASNNLKHQDCEGNW